MPDTTHQILHKRALELGYKPGSPKYGAFVYGTLAHLQEIKRRKKTEHKESNK